MKHLIISVCAISLIVISAAFLIKKENTSKWSVGDVRISMIPPSKFKTQNPGWIEMNGDTVRNSKFAIAFRKDTVPTVPDATNKFIRGMGGYYDGVDVKLEGQKRKVGGIQTYSTKLPHNPFVGTTSSNGLHTHNLTLGTYEGANWKGQQHFGFSRAPYYKGTVTKTTDGDPKRGSHGHNVVINKGGDNETRPTNIALYIYIKIN